VIRHDQTLKSAASFGRPACEFAPDSPGAQDYVSLCEWLIEHSEIDRASAEEMLEFDGLEDLGRREAPGEGHATPRLRADRSAAIAEPAPAEGVGPTPDQGFTETISRLEDLTRRARALQRTASEISPKPGIADERGHADPAGPSEETLRAMFTTGRPMLPPPADPGADEGGDRRTLTAVRAGARIASAVATLNRIPRPVVLEVAEEEPTRARPIVVVDSVRRLLGARRTSRGALFVQPIDEGGRLSVAGSFNGWCAQTHPMRRNDALGVFELQIELGPGQHEYKLVIDGRWVAERYNPIGRPDDFGGVNSVVELPDPRGV